MLLLCTSESQIIKSSVRRGCVSEGCPYIYLKAVMPHSSPSPSPDNLAGFAIVLVLKVIAWIGLIPVLYPFLDISCHVIDTVSTFAVFKGAYRQKSVVCAERICLFNIKFIAPWKPPAVNPSCSLFPLSL